METINSIIQNVTTEYLAAHVRKGDDNFDEIEAEIVRRTQSRVRAQNAVCMKGDPRITMPSRLNAWQVACILNAIMYIHTVKLPGQRSPVLVVWDGEKYDTDLRQLRLAIIRFNNSLPASGISEVENRLKIIAEPVEPCDGDRFTAYTNGVMDNSTMTFLPHSPERIIMHVEPNALRPGDMAAIKRNNRKEC